MFKEIFIGISSLLTTETSALSPNVNLSPIRVVYNSLARENTLSELDKINLKMINFQVEFNESVLPKFLTNRQKLAKLVPGGELDDIESIRKYYLIWRFAEDAYGIKWTALMLEQAHESTFSKNPIAFYPNRLVIGAMQRSRELYPQSQVEEAARGYEFLAKLPQNHPTDWKEIMWAAWKLDQDARATVNADKKDRNWVIGDAIERYSPDGQKRREEFEVLRGIFG
ncbi:hypothetical protein HYZ78_03945 [Candidatus Microgenomates bacterium]|nr:hypothetical protein [Candidatus Microgenomates bacterium]